MKAIAIRALLGIWTLVFTVSSWASSDRQVLLVSDLHVGAGEVDKVWKKIEDFRWQSDFNSFLNWIGRQQTQGSDLVFVGDTFELWQSPTMTCTDDLSNPECKVPDCHEEDADLGCTEDEALARFEAVLKAHGDFVTSIRGFASVKGNRVYFIPGNHDAALLFPRVQSRLLEDYKGLPVWVQSAGYWLSDDGKVYADHGHQFDDLNQFTGWPKPFTQVGGKSYLRKPWGENMVQQFYNQYEFVFPIVDNLSDEWTGVKFALAQADFKQKSTAVGKLFRFILFQESLRQAGQLLGDEEATEWNRGAVRKKPVQFFFDILKPDSILYASALQAQDRAALTFDPSKLTDREIDAICASKANLVQAARCEKRDETLNAVLKGALVGEAQLRVNYLRKVLPAVSGNGMASASIVVFGHTHHADGPMTIALGELKGGSVNVTYANTGAFQRVASPQQIQAILARPDMKSKSPLDLQPEHLPACYTFVWVKPYKNEPGVKLVRWSQSSDGTFADSEGGCLGSN